MIHSRIASGPTHDVVVDYLVVGFRGQLAEDKRVVRKLKTTADCSDYGRV